MSTRTPQPKRQTSARTVALCYIRLSYNDNPSEADSPERQRANCEAFCRKKGWIPEFFDDSIGHKSGTQEKNRPRWLALKQRMHDPDVVAIVANDLARLHRKGWRVGQLIDWVEEHGVYLALALPGRELDFSNPRDRLTATFIAMLDEYYAADIGARVKDSIVYRKSKGVTVGQPPFGTIRDAAGYLIPSPYGAWRLPNGDFMAGREGDKPPLAEAVWKGYYACAQTILEKYRDNQQGTDGLAHTLEDEGWVFRSRLGSPRRLTGDDIRRVVGNWREYAGLVSQGRAKDKNASMLDDAPAVLYDTGRAVFPLELLRAVARIQTHRSITKRPPGAKQIAYAYPLMGLLRCAHCEQQDLEKNDPTLQSKISGTHKPQGYYYRHAESQRCTCAVRSVECSVIEADFVRLLGLLSLKPEAFPSMFALSLALHPVISAQSEADFQQEKADAIAKGRRKIEAARFLFEDGDLTRAEYLQRKAQQEAELAHWEARTSDDEQAAQELMLCVDALDKMTQLWDYATPEDKQGLARLLFESITYDLGARRLTDFRPKPWADKYLIVRAALYEAASQPDAVGAMPLTTPIEDNDKAIPDDENGLENQTAPIMEPFLSNGAIRAPIGSQRRNRVLPLRGHNMLKRHICGISTTAILNLSDRFPQPHVTN